MVVIRKFMTEAKADAVKAEVALKDIVAKLEANPGVKLIAKYANYVLVGIEKDAEAIAKDPTLQKAYDAVEAKIKADLEAVGNLTVKQIVDAEINFVKKVILFFKKLFAK